MKVNGVPVTAPPEEILVLPRPDGDLVFRAKALPNWDEFHKLCKEPEPPKIKTKDGVQEDFNDPNYKSAYVGYCSKQNAYLVIKSLEPSNIEWDKVDPTNPNTWSNWLEEMQAAGLTAKEGERIVQLCWDANCLNEAKLEAARKAFLRTLPKA